MNAATYTKSGAKSSTPAKLSKSVFGVEVVNHALLKTAYLAYLANGRVNLAKTKSRGEVRGGGRKPIRQKGTGNARVGSTRNPIWTGGGVAFGPKGSENYSIKITPRSKKTALRQALSLAAGENRIKIIETFERKEGRVKPTLALVKNLGSNGSVLMVVSVKDELAERATRNLPGLKLVQADYLNVYDVLNSDEIVISKKSLAIIEERLGTSK